MSLVDTRTDPINVKILERKIVVSKGIFTLQITHTDQLLIIDDLVGIYMINRGNEYFQLDFTSYNVIEMNAESQKVTDQFVLSKNPVSAYKKFSSYFTYSMFNCCNSSDQIESHESFLVTYYIFIPKESAME